MVWLPLTLVRLSAHLIGVADLRKFAFEVVADGEAARNSDEGNAFAAGTQTGSDADVGIALGVAVIETGVRGDDRWLQESVHEVGVLRMQEVPWASRK